MRNMTASGSRSESRHEIPYTAGPLDTFIVARKVFLKHTPDTEYIVDWAIMYKIVFS